MFKVEKIIERIKNIISLFVQKMQLFKNKYEIDRQNKFAQIIINATDPEELKNKIVKEIATSLDANNCFFLEYDSATNSFKKVVNIYNKSRNVLNLLGYDIERNIPTLAMKQKYMKSIVIEDTEKFIWENNLKGSNEESYFKTHNVKSAMSVRLEFGEAFLGTIVVHYDKKKPGLKFFDFTFLQNIAEHVSIAFYLSKLYVEEKYEKEKEQLLRSIISIINRSYNLSQIITKIFKILSQIYRIKNVFIDITEEGFEKFYAYDFSAHDVKVLDNIDRNELLNIYDLQIFESTRNKVNYIPNIHNFVVQNNLENSEVEQFFDSNSIKSLILMPIVYENNPMGLLIMHFDINNPLKKDDLEFINAINSQLAIAIIHIHDFEREKKALERARILKDITEKIRSSLNVEEALSFICEEVAKLFNVQRSVIAYSPEPDNAAYFTKIKEYKINPSIQTISEKNTFNKVTSFWTESLAKLKKPLIFNNIDETDVPEFFKDEYRKIGIKSAMGSAIKKGDDIWGCFMLFEYNRYRHWSAEEINLLEIISTQVYIAINQAELYSTLKQVMQKQNAILSNIPYWAWIKDADGRYILVNAELANAAGMEADELIGKTDFDIFPKELAQKYFNDDVNVMRTRKLKTTEEETVINGQHRFFETYKQPFLDDDGKVIGIIGISKDITEKKETELELLRRQEAIVKAIDREQALRRIVEIVRSSLDIEVVKTKFVTEVGKYFSADRCFIYEYRKDTKDGIYSEYVSSAKIRKISECDSDTPQFKHMKEVMRSKDLQKSIIIKNFQEYISENNLSDTPIATYLMELEIKTIIGLPIYYFEELYGELIIHYTEKPVDIDSQDIIFIKNLADQAGIAIHQSKLYEIVKIQAEREKISRNIIEILRSSIDKVIIKKLFVKNIGKFFDADRVILSEYDSDRRIYHPVDSNAEYLSDYDVKSLVGYDWLSPEACDYIQYLMDKRELNILSLESEMAIGQKGQELLNFFEEVGVKSSYNFPILYQQEIMGFFRIDFSRKVSILSDEEINRIRSLCTQAGIALYHADLYLKAQECMYSRKLFVGDISERISQSTNNILDNSILLSQNDYQRHVQIKYLSSIISSCNQLLELTREISID